jgi:hypothetical protein
MVSEFRGFSSRLPAAGGRLLAVFLAGALAAGLASAASGEEKWIPVRIIPRKVIPKQVRYRQAPAIDPRQKKNRVLVLKARKERRRLHRTGTAYGMDFR